MLKRTILDEACSDEQRRGSVTDESGNGATARNGFGYGGGI